MKKDFMKSPEEMPLRFKKAWDLQEKLLKEAVEKKLHSHEPVSNYILFCRHPHVYTLGKHGDPTHLLLDKQELKEKEIEYYHTNRGGDITYHGPGQIVVYPILDLEIFGRNIRRYLRNLEEVVIQTLDEYGLKGERIAGATGVWLEANTSKARKICAMGIRCSHWVTIHGIALNVNTDLSYFDNIIPCGITDKGVAGMKQELGKKVNEQAVKNMLRRKFEQIFEAPIRGVNMPLKIL